MWPSFWIKQCSQWNIFIFVLFCNICIYMPGGGDSSEPFRHIWNFWCTVNLVFFFRHVITRLGNLINTIDILDQISTRKNSIQTIDSWCWREYDAEHKQTNNHSSHLKHKWLGSKYRILVHYVKTLVSYEGKRKRGWLADRFNYSSNWCKTILA